MGLRSSLAILFSFTLTAVGCSGSGNSSASSTASASPTPTAATAAIECMGIQAETASAESLDSLDIVKPTEARLLTLAEVLRSDSRFTQFHSLAGETLTGIMEGGSRLSWLDIWDWPPQRMGDDREGVTIFVPTDAGFEDLEPQIRRALDEGQLDNRTRYTWLGHHYVHRLYPSSEFVAGPQRTWSTSPGAAVDLTLDPPTWGGCPILQADLRTANGYIHVIGGVVMPHAVLDAID